MTDNRSATKPTLSERTAEEIRALLARRRISGRELARRMGASHSWVNFRLTGAQPITLDDLERFAAILDVDVYDLLPRRDEERPVGHTLTRHRQTTVAKLHPTNQPRPNGHPKRTTPTTTTRRPVRIHVSRP